MKTHYTYFDTLMADPNKPMPQAARDHHLGAMHKALENIATAEAPTKDDWRLLSDCVNLMETLVTRGPWLDTVKKPNGLRDLIHVEDKAGLLPDAVRALAEAGARHQRDGKPIRLDGLGLQALRATLEDYEACLNTLSERSMILAHRGTELRIQEILAGKRKPHDIEIVDL